MTNPRASEPGKRNVSHGLRNTGAWKAWKAMMQRCYSVNHYAYRWYGGADPPIGVCDRWHDVVAFHADMGDRPEPHPTLGPYELDREETDMEYCRANCIWRPKLVNVYRRNNPVPHDAQGLPIGSESLSCPF